MPSHLIQFSPEYTLQLYPSFSALGILSFVLCNTAITTHIWMDIKYSGNLHWICSLLRCLNVHILINSSTTPGSTIFGSKHIFKGFEKQFINLISFSKINNNKNYTEERQIWWLIQLELEHLPCSYTGFVLAFILEYYWKSSNLFNLGFWEQGYMMNIRTHQNRGWFSDGA